MCPWAERSLGSLFGFNSYVLLFTFYYPHLLFTFTFTLYVLLSTFTFHFHFSVCTFKFPVSVPFSFDFPLCTLHFNWYSFFCKNHGISMIFTISTHFFQKKVCVFAIFRKIKIFPKVFSTVFASFSKSAVLSHVYNDFNMISRDSFRCASISPGKNILPRLFGNLVCWEMEWQSLSSFTFQCQSLSYNLDKSKIIKRQHKPERKMALGDLGN